jgi:flagellar hook protein FlgE
MMRALFAGVSGLRNHQTRMDVIGNNIANVNTVGFKGSRVTFKEAFFQTLSGASRTQQDLGGLNPMEIGTGVNLGSIDTLFTQGSLETTGQPMDLAIQGSSLFVVGDGSRHYYTRAGDFQFDASGNLVSPETGYIVQGILADSDGTLSSTAAVGNVQIQLGQRAAARQTSNVTLLGNLNDASGVGDTHSMGITVYDPAGASHQLKLLFTKTGAGAWSWTANLDGTDLASTTPGTVTFDSSGKLGTFTYPDSASALTLTTAGGTTFGVTIDAGTPGTIDGISGFANASNAVVSAQDGYQAGDLTNLSVDARGVITGYFSNGVTRSLAQIALAQFSNPAGLVRNGDNVYTESANSGAAVLGFAGGTNSSTLTPGALESSNVDISQQFTDMIIAQRGFQANARVITTADEMLNELVNLRRG